MRAKEVSVALRGEFGEPSNPDREDPLHGRTQPLAQRSPVSDEAVANPAVRAPALGRGDITVCGTGKRLPLGSLIGACRRLALSTVRAVPAEVRDLAESDLAESQWTSLRDASCARTRLRHGCIGADQL